MLSNSVCARICVYVSVYMSSSACVCGALPAPCCWIETDMAEDYGNYQHRQFVTASHRH